MQRKKIIKSFKQLSELNRREIINNDGKIKRINPKFAVSFARQISEGFDIDLRKQPTKSQIRRAREVIKEFYSATRSQKVKLVRPRKNNRKYYAEYSELPRKFKVFAVPVYGDGDYFKIVTSKLKGKKTKRIKRIGEFSSTEFFKFPNKKELVKNPKNETDKLFNKIEQKYKKKKTAVKIKCGKHEYKTLYEDKSPYIEIENWINIYGKDEVKKWCVGFQVYTFQNQQPMPTKKLPLKKKK